MHSTFDGDGSNGINLDGPDTAFGREMNMLLAYTDAAGRCDEAAPGPVRLCIDTRQQFTAASAGLLPMLTRMAKRLDDRNWEDLLQDTLTLAWRGRAQFQPGTNFKAWLITILKNAFKSAIRRTRHHAAWEDHYGDRLTQAPDQEAALLRTELTGALAALDVDQRAALLSVIEHDASYAQAAERLGITLPALKTRIHRARKRMMKFLEHGIPIDLQPGRMVDGLMPLAAASLRPAR